MADFETHLTRWQTAGLLDSSTATRIRAWEQEQTKPAGLRWQVLVALILGAILLACGVVLFVNAHWDQIGPGARFALVMGMVAVFHLGGAATRKDFRGLSTALHAVGTVSTGAAIALVGQIFNIQEHWPAAVLMWAVAAAFGWLLLGDEAQQTLTLLLVPAWILSEFSYGAEGYIGENVYLGRFLIVWGILFLTFFLGSKRKINQGVLFVVGAIIALVGICVLLTGWVSWRQQDYLPLGLRIWGWIDIAALPLLLAVLKFRKSLIPVVVAIVFGIALPWCQHIWTEHFDNGNIHNAYTRNEPNIAAHILVALFCVFIIWWGVRLVSQALVNVGVVGFAISVGWFFFSNVWDKMNRSLGLIGLGVLFLAGGWGLESMRRRLVKSMGEKPAGEAL
jgi:uncharacterized membrane protein